MGSAVRLAAAAVATFGALAAPAGLAWADKTAEQTISELQSQGYTVNIDRIGTAPMSQCVVTSVRNPQEQTRLIRVDGPGNRDQVIRVVVRRTITVSLDCSR